MHNKTMVRRLFVGWLLAAILCLPGIAQIQEPVKFEVEWKQHSPGDYEIIFSGTMDAGWHVYSTDLPEGGPISATLNIDEMEGAELAERERS